MIKVEDVHFTYPTGVEAIRGVTIRMEDGEFVAIMGENGAGKTTLVKHFNGLLKPTRGYVEVDGIDTRNASVAELSRKVGLVFQNSDHQLFSETVEEEIAFGLRNFGFDAQTISKRVEWALNLLDLVEYRKSSPFMLSGGERKRLALASVLAWDPQIIVLDEPTIGQDYQQKEKLREFIAQLIAQKRTVIVVTHDVEFVAECCPRVILMSRGEVVADGPATRILTDYETVTRVSLLPPQVTQILLRLSDLGLPSNIINIYDARRLLSERILKAGLR
jgi:energy-coupling factor transport system ATP-binding protein